MKSIKGQKICDAHLHCHKPILFEDGFANFIKRMKDRDIAAGSLLSFPTGERVEDDCFSDNISCLYYKYKLNGSYAAYADFYDYPDDPDYYLDFARKHLEMGFDGFKSLLGLPSVRKRIGIGINNPRFDKFFAFLEENEIPYVIHVGNPEMFWDINRIPEKALKKGRFFDETFLTLEELRQEFLDVLKKFPKLHVTLAHGFFMGNDCNRLKEIMDTYENVCIDLTPNIYLFEDMSQDISLWRTFFETYHKRILFGSDTYVPDTSMNTPLADAVCGFLETEGTFTCYNGTVIKCLNLSGEILENICWNNGINRANPSPINKHLVIAECERLLANEPRLNDWEKDNLEIAISEFSK